MNIITPRLDTAIDPALPLENTLPGSPTAEVPANFSKLLAKQELPEFMQGPALPVVPLAEQTVEKDSEIEVKATPDDNAQTPVMAYFPYDINPILGQIDHLTRTSQRVSTGQQSENDNPNPEMLVNNFKKTDLQIQANSQKAIQWTDSTEVSQQLTKPDTTTSVAASVIKNDFKKLFTTQAQDNKLSNNNETEMKAILTDTDSADPQKILTSPVTAPSLQPLPDLQDNKYVNVLSQFGSFINSQTASHINNDSTPAQTFYTNTTSVAETFRKTPQLEMETKIELLPATLDGLNKETYNANIKIYPPELGHVLAKLKVDKNTAELVITADNNVVKQIIEAHLPQLRENFQTADITLTHVHVQTAEANVGGQENSGNQQSNQADNKKEWNPQSDQPVSQATQQRRLNSIIDTYA